VLPCDEDKIQKYNEKHPSDYQLKLTAFPEPYFGDIAAPVVLLALNPGFAESDLEIMRGPNFKPCFEATMPKRRWIFLLLSESLYSEFGGSHLVAAETQVAYRHVPAKATRAIASLRRVFPLPFSSLSPCKASPTISGLRICFSARSDSETSSYCDDEIRKIVVSEGPRARKMPPGVCAQKSAKCRCVSPQLPRIR
jgi:hypothetical protein